MFNSLLWFIAVLIWIWCIACAGSLDDYIPKWLGACIVGLIAIGIPLLLFFFWSARLAPTFALIAVFIALNGWLICLTPTHDRDWGIAQATLPYAKITGSESDEIAEVNNIRSFRYGPVSPKHSSHYSDKFKLSKLKRVWFGVDRFTTAEPLAHTFLSFEFEPGSHKTNFLAFSVETRREKDEDFYSPIRGCFNNYEIIYVIADEQDVLSIRSDVRENVVQLYPIRATQQQTIAMFKDMLKRTNGIHKTPEFYHTLTNNCTNNIVYHTNNVLNAPISAYQRGVVFPGYSDWLAYQLGIIDTELPLVEARERFRIDQRVKNWDGKSDFSEFIRERE
ncbi:MAG: DUF4105 domain-containing protein [Mariniblastus sp.]